VTSAAAPGSPDDSARSLLKLHSDDLAAAAADVGVTARTFQSWLDRESKPSTANLRSLNRRLAHHSDLQIVVPEAWKAATLAFVALGNGAFDGAPFLKADLLATATQILNELEPAADPKPDPVTLRNLADRLNGWLSNIPAGATTVADDTPAVVPAIDPLNPEIEVADAEIEIPEARARNAAWQALTAGALDPFLPPYTAEKRDWLLGIAESTLDDPYLRWAATGVTAGAGALLFQGDPVVGGAALSTTAGLYLWQVRRVVRTLRRRLLAETQRQAPGGEHDE